MKQPSVISLWNKMQRLPMGKQLFSRTLGWMIPYSGSISAQMIELKKGYAKIQLPDHRKVRNHLNCIHALAIANLGEMTSGLALTFSLPENAQIILKNLMIDYLKKGRGTLTAECHVDSIQFDSQNELSHEEILEVDIKDPKNEVIARVTAVWRVRLN